jgi:cysteine desulfurase
VPVQPSGVVRVEDVAAAVDEQTTVVACMLANNELGTIQPIAEIARAVKARRREVHVHCDAVQGFCKIPLRAPTLGVDSIAVSGHKIHGPKGVGALWLRKGARVLPLWMGGGQQKGLRSGTENVPGIAGFGAAARLAHAGIADLGGRVRALRDRLEAELARAELGVRVNGAAAPRLPHISSLSFPGLSAETLLHALEARGVFVSAGSACASANHGPTHVLEAIGSPPDAGTLRLSLSRDVTDEDMAYVVRVLIEEARGLAR